MFADGAHVISEDLGLFILAHLEIGIDQELVRVHLVRAAGLACRFRLLRRGHRSQVRIDILLPHAKPGKDMSRHVQRMRRRRRNPGILPRSPQAVRRQRRRVAGVNDVVRQSRMLRMRREQRHQDGQRLVLMGQRRVVRRHGSQHRQSVEGRSLHVVRKLAMQRVHLRLIGIGPLLKRNIGGVEERAQRRDVRLLTRRDRRRRRSQRASLGHLFRAPLQRCCIGTPPQLLELRHRNTPVRHRASRIILGDGLKLHLRLGISEGVQQSDTALHRRLRPGSTRGGKGHVPQLLGRIVVVVMLHTGHRWRLGIRMTCQQRAADKHKRDRSHKLPAYPCSARSARAFRKQGIW